MVAAVLMLARQFAAATSLTSQDFSKSITIQAPSTFTVSGIDANGYSVSVASGIDAGNGCLLVQGGQICGPSGGSSTFTGGAVANATTFASSVTINGAGGLAVTGSSMTLNGLTDYGSMTRAQIQAKVCATLPCRVQLSQAPYDVFVATAAGTAGAFMNERTGVGP